MSNDQTVTGLSQRMHGSGNRLNSHPLVAKRIDINLIWPDPVQPRRTMPSAVLHYHYDDGSTPRTLADFFAVWLWMAAHESGTGYPYDITPHITGDDDANERSTPIGPIEASLIELCGLAKSILDKGLQNPITVAKQDNHYVLETGERRWMAFNLLRVYTESDVWNTIPAFTVDKSDVWRQAAENAQRQNLNAIGRARQYALLLMALNPGAPITPYHECASDREFYAQAIDLVIPSGHRKNVLTVMGITSPGQLTTYRKTLALDDETWQRADDNNATETALFSTLNTPISEQENAQKTAQKPPKTPSQPPRPFIEKVEKQFGDYAARFDKLRERIRKDTKTDYSQLEPLIDEQIEQLRKLKKQIKG